jgi:hypothetical protein
MDVRISLAEFCDVRSIRLTLLHGREISDHDSLRILFLKETTSDDAILSGWLSAISILTVLAWFSTGRFPSRRASDSLRSKRSDASCEIVPSACCTL